MESPTLFIMTRHYVFEGVGLFKGSLGSLHSTYIWEQASMQVITVSDFLALMADSKGDDWMCHISITQLHRCHSP